MSIPRKPDRKDSVEGFIKHAPARRKVNDEKKGRKVVSLSLMVTDADWIDEILNKINEKTERKITRSEVISAAIGVLKEKNLDSIMELIKNR